MHGEVGPRPCCTSRAVGEGMAPDDEHEDRRNDDVDEGGDVAPPEFATIHAALQGGEQGPAALDDVS